MVQPHETLVAAQSEESRVNLLFIHSACKETGDV
jgi:hypothetical protein